MKNWIELVAQRPPGMQPAQRPDPENLKPWYRIEPHITNQDVPEEEPDEYDVYVYDAIGGWDGVAAEDFVRDLRTVTAQRINLRINSPGGSVFDGITIANALRAHNARVTTYVDGIAASIASVIALAGDRVVMMPQSQLMIHDASGMCMGNPADMLKMAELLDKQSDNIAAAYAARGGGTADMWRDLMRAETWYLAEEAVEVGLANEAMPVPPPDEGRPAHRPASIPRNVWDLSVFRYAGRENAPAPVASGMSVIKERADELQQIADATTPVSPADKKIVVDVHSPEFAEEIRAVIRQEIRAELAVIEGTAVGSHSTSTQSGTWDAGANEKRLPSPVPLATVRKMYTYYDESQVEDGKVPKTACKLPHHFVGADGSPGAASLNGVRNALARLPQTQGLSDAERRTAEAHLRAHLRAGGGGDEEDLAHEENVENHEHGYTPKFDVGDRVKVTVAAHEEGQDTGVVAEINDGPAYGIRFDNAEGGHDGDVHHWYVEDELEAASDEGPPGNTTATDQGDDWDSVVALLVSTITSPSADDVFPFMKEEW